MIREGLCRSSSTRSSIYVNLSRPCKIGKLPELLCSDIQRRERGRIRFSIVSELDQNVWMAVGWEGGEFGRDGEHWAVCAAGVDNIHRGLSRVPEQWLQAARWTMGGDIRGIAMCWEGHGSIPWWPFQTPPPLCSIRSCRRIIYLSICLSSSSLDLFRKLHSYSAAMWVIYYLLDLHARNDGHCSEPWPQRWGGGRIGGKEWRSVCLWFIQAFPWHVWRCGESRFCLSRWVLTVSFMFSTL